MLFEVHMTVKVYIVIFWVLTPGTIADGYQRLGRNW